MAIGSGKRDQLISVQSRQSGRDGAGQPVDAWVEIAKPWASVRFPSGMQTIKAGADVSVVRVSFRILARSGIDAGMRVVYRGQNYDIRAVPPSNDRQFIDLVAEAVK